MTTMDTEQHEQLPDEATDTRAHWPTVYACVIGLIALLIGSVVGVAKLHTPYVFSIVFMAALISLWGLQRIKALGSHRPITLLGIAIVGVVAIVAPLIGFLFGAWQPPLLLSVGAGVFGSAVLLMAIANRAPTWTLVGLIAFAVLLVFMAQHSLHYAAFEQQQQEQQQRQEPRSDEDEQVVKDNCELFPADPACQE